MMMTSSQAGKKLRKLNEEYLKLLSNEIESKEFRCSLGEDPESLRPKYDFKDTQKKISEIEKSIRKLKHSINQFNTIQVIPEFNITIDEMLVYIPQLTKAKEKLGKMRSGLIKQRYVPSHYENSNIIDYVIKNYDITEVEANYNKVSDILASAQIALDRVNTSVEYDFDVK